MTAPVEHDLVLGAGRPGAAGALDLGRRDRRVDHVVQDEPLPPPVSPGEIVAGKRAITADTDLRLCRFFGLSDGWWLRLQADYDTELMKDTLAKTLAKIKPWPHTDAA